MVCTVVEDPDEIEPVAPIHKLCKDRLWAGGCWDARGLGVTNVSVMYFLYNIHVQQPNMGRPSRASLRGPRMISALRHPLLL